MSVGGFQEWALSQPVVPEHQLLGSVCICGGWSAQCGQDIAEQWRQHVNGICRSCRADELVGDETTPPGERLTPDAARSVVDELRDHARGGTDE